MLEATKEAKPERKLDRYVLAICLGLLFGILAVLAVFDWGTKEKIVSAPYAEMLDTGQWAGEGSELATSVVETLKRTGLSESSLYAWKISETGEVILAIDASTLTGQITTTKTTVIPEVRDGAPRPVIREEERQVPAADVLRDNIFTAYTGAQGGQEGVVTLADEIIVAVPNANDCAALINAIKGSADADIAGRLDAISVELTGQALERGNVD